MNHQPARLSVLKEALEDLGSASHAARLQLHLLSMEARQRTGQLGTTIENLEHRIDRGIHQALATAAEKTRQLARTVQDTLGRQASAQSRVGSLMTGPVHTCSPQDSLARAAQIMWDTDCGAVPVVDTEGRLCGILTDRDVCMGAYTKGGALNGIRVGEVMSARVRTCSPGDSLERAADIMAEAQVRRLPVVDAGGRPVGMLSLADVARGAPLLGQREGEALAFQLLSAVSKRRSTATAVGPRLAAE